MNLCMVIEKFRSGDALTVYRSFRGRLTPDGVRYINSWVVQRTFGESQQ
jgi:hypothetical protein